MRFNENGNDLEVFSQYCLPDDNDNSTHICTSYCSNFVHSHSINGENDIENVDKNENISTFIKAESSKRKYEQKLQNKYSKRADNIDSEKREVIYNRISSRFSNSAFVRNNHRRCAKNVAATFFIALSKTAALIFPALQLAVNAAASMNVEAHIVSRTSSQPTVITMRSQNDTSIMYFKQMYQQLASTANSRATIDTSTVISPGVANNTTNGSSFMHMRLALTITHLLLVSLGSVNLLVIFIILLRPYMRSITNVYMLSLCLADFIYLTNLSLVAATQLNEKSWPFGDVMCVIYHGTETTGKYASVLFVVLLAVDRYYCMCKVNECARYRNFRIAIILSLMAWTAAIFAAFPLYYFAEVALLQFRNISKIHKLCIAKWPSSDSARWYITVSSVLIFALPLVLIIFCYYHIINKMREALKRCKRMRRGARSRAPYHRVTRLVLWVVVFHVICWSPFWLFNLFSSIFRLRISTQFDRIVINIIHLFPYVNCALNPLLYAIHAENFRIAFRSLFCRSGDEGVLNSRNPTTTNNNNSSNAENTIVKRANSATESAFSGIINTGSVYKEAAEKEEISGMSSVILNGYAPVIRPSAFPKFKNGLQYSAVYGHADGEELVSNRINPCKIDLIRNKDSVSTLNGTDGVFDEHGQNKDSEIVNNDAKNSLQAIDSNTNANSVTYSLVGGDAHNEKDCRMDKRDPVRELFRTLSFLPRKRSKKRLMRHKSALTPREMNGESATVIPQKLHSILKAHNSGSDGGVKNVKCTLDFGDGDKFV